MKKINLFAILFAIASVLFFAGCDNDNDKKDGDTNPPVEECKCDDGTACPDGGKEACAKPAPTCDPACNAETEDCLCEADKCECRAKDAPAACDPACEDGKTKCECTNDACACVPVNPPTNECDGKNVGDECAEGKTCQAEGEGLACKDKPADPPAQKCDPACDEATQDCVCDADKCECKTKDAAAPTQPDPAE